LQVKQLSSAVFWYVKDFDNIPDNGSFPQMPGQRIQLWWAVPHIPHTGSSSDIIRNNCATRFM